MKTIALFMLLMGTLAKAQSQPGCTDPLANNYDAAAIENNGSCTYNTTNYSPIIKVDPLSDSVVENSGLQFANGYLWTFNDQLNKPQLYRIDTASNTVQQRVYLKGITNTDWEDIAFDGTYFYIGDFGNNNTGGRANLKIYKFPFAAIDLANAIDTIQPNNIETIHFIYSNQPQPVAPTGYNNTKYDCEAMIVDNNKIHLFSKNWVGNTTTHYVINSTSAGNYIAEATETFDNGYLVTAADKMQGQNIIVLIGYVNSGFGNHYMHILSDYRADSFFTGNKRKIDLGDATVMGQAEGIAFRNGKYGYISNEKFVRMVGPVTLTVNQKLKSFDISGLVSNYFTKYIFTGNGNWSDSDNWKDKMAPPPSLVAGNEIIIDPIAGGVCLLDIPFTMPSGTKLTISNDKSFVMNGNLTVQ